MQGQGQSTRQPTAGEAAHQIIRAAVKASLATLECRTGFPYASLVMVGFGPDGTPLLLLSRLAVHTANLLADHRASLLFDASDGAGDPLAGGRVTVIGHMAQITANDTVRRRFLARHPGAEVYVDFADFSFWQMAVERAHYIGGFGRIVDLTAGDILADVSGAQKLIDAESDIVAHMNDDHGDTIQLYATRLGGAEPGAWRMTGIDPAGVDLVDNGRGVRLNFGRRVTDPDDARAELVRLAHVARAGTG